MVENMVNSTENNILIESDDDLNWVYSHKLRQLFDQVLQDLISKSSSLFRPIPPLIDNSPVDLFRLFGLVRCSGGFATVSKDDRWVLVTNMLGFDGRLSGLVKLVYYKYLYELDLWLDGISKKEGSECEKGLELKEKIGLLCGEKRGVVFEGKLVECVEISEGSEVDDNDDDDGVVVIDVDDYDEICSKKKKQKMSPFISDVSFPNDNTSEGLSSDSEHSTSYSPTDDDDQNTESPSKCIQEIAHSHNQHAINTRENTLNSLNDPPFKGIPIGSTHQAEVPIWDTTVPKSDPKWLGTQVWSPDTTNSSPDFGQPGQGRVDSCCDCSFPDSVECCRLHIAERRMKLRSDLGLFFFHWKFDQMGEEASLSWSDDEEKTIKKMIRLSKMKYHKFFLSKKKCIQVFRIKKRWTELVSYYFNVYKINRRGHQNRVTPQEIDSDDDKMEFEPVSKPYGYTRVSDTGLHQL